MIEKIKNKKKLLSIIIRANYKSENIKFFTPRNFSQQLGYMNRPKGYEIIPHNHNKIKRKILTTDETLIIKSGRVRIDFYDEKKKYLMSKILNKGDVILLVNGGHGFEMLEKTEIIEVKQGPYLDDKDKTRFDPVKKNKLKIK
tara:strand:- start:162 stop:590 length:429 start_codon:yes stop_codon:yes gene_type:complete